MNKKAKALENLLECVDVLQEGWTWFPVDQYATEQCICYTEDMIAMQRAYLDYRELEATETEYSVDDKGNEANFFEKQPNGTWEKAAILDREAGEDANETEWRNWGGSDLEAWANENGYSADIRDAEAIEKMTETEKTIRDCCLDQLKCLQNQGHQVAWQATDCGFDFRLHDRRTVVVEISRSKSTLAKTVTHARSAKAEAEGMNFISCTDLSDFMVYLEA